MRQFEFRRLRIFSAVILTVALLVGGHAAAIVCFDTCTTDTSTLFGQTQSYDVLLRGNGAAVVNTRVNLSNNSEQPISKLSYEVVSGQLADVTAFQQVTCSGLPIYRPLSSTGGASSGTGQTGINQPSPVVMPPVPECYPQLKSSVQSAPPAASSAPAAPANLLPQYYPISTDVYKAVTVSKSGNTMNLALPQPIANGQSSTLVMAYSVDQISQQHFGVFHYSFKTLKSASPVSDVTVAISVDENYFLADAAQSKVNYRPASNVSALSTDLQSGSLSSVNGLVDAIGTNGSLETCQLACGERDVYG